MKNITSLLRLFPILLISDIILNISHIIQIICLILNKIRKINVFTSQVFFYIPHCGIHKWIKILIFYYVVNWFWLDKKLRSPGSQLANQNYCDHPFYYLNLEITRNRWSSKFESCSFDVEKFPARFLHENVNHFNSS